MQDKKKQNKPWIKKGPLKTFLFFLGFSTIIWVFVQFSKQYTTVIELPVSYVNLPKDKILLENSPKYLDLRIQDKGFNIAIYKFFPKVLNIDLSEAEPLDGQLVYNLELHKEAIFSKLRIDYENAGFLQENLKIDFQQRTVKRVPINSKINTGFSVGYSALDKIKLQPDSITVSGPENILDTLRQVNTKALKIGNINKDLEGRIKLDKSNLGTVTFYQDEVSYSQRTDKFTEGKVEIPIEMINVPENMNAVIFPKEVIVYYQVSLHEFDKVKPSNFKVIVDFKNSVDSDGYLLAQIVKHPDIVNNLRLNENRILFVIKR
jgi:hypothetical protein